MTYLKLRDVKSGEVHEFDGELVRVGREPGQELVLTGDAARVASGHHAQFSFHDGAWNLEDLGSSNGTYVDDKRLTPGTPVPVDAGHTLAFGLGGPRLVIDAVHKRATPKTVIEHASGPKPARPSAPTERMAGLGDVTAPPQPAVPRTPPGDRPRVRLSAPTEKLRGLDADAALAEAKAHHHDAAPTAKPPAEHPPRASQPAAPPKTPAPPPPPPRPQAASPAPAAAATTVSPAAGTPQPAEARASSGAKAATVLLRELRNNQTFTVRGGRIRIGRGDECELRPVSAGDTSVSRVHAELVLRPEGGVVVRDAGSRNGTIVNGLPVTGETLIHRGDVILLGEGGPQLKVEELSGPGVVEAPPRVETPRSLARRSFGGKGATAFMRELVTETAQKSSSKLRWVIWSFVVVLVGLTGAGWFYLQQQAQQTSAVAAQLSAARAQADSIRQASQAEYNRLTQALDSARSSGAQSGAIDSIRRALTEQMARTANLDSSLHRAESALTQQTAAAEAQRKAAQNDLQRVQAQLEKAQQNQGGASGAQAAQLQHLFDSMTHRVTQLNEQVRALKGADLGAVAQANQAAVGLVTTWFKGKGFDGTGFVITKSGVMVTNRHVATEREGDVILRPDSIQVQMADQRELLYADYVIAAPDTGADVAVLKVRGYHGPYLARIDWADTTVHQGEPGVLIGFPAGVQLALDQQAIARTSVSSGTFSQVTEREIRFNGFTVGGSSGSPVFNGDGALVGLHRAGIRDAEGHLAVGLGIAVPIRELVRYLPADVKAELGLR